MKVIVKLELVLVIVIVVIEALHEVAEVMVVKLKNVQLEEQCNGTIAKGMGI